MAGGIKGIVVKIGGDTTELGRALSSASKQSNALQSELKGVNSLLKMDPKNMTLLKQKSDLLKQSIQETSTKLKSLKTMLAKADTGEIKMTEAEYRNLQREIANTENKLKSLNNEQKNFGSAGARQIAQMGNNIKDFGGKVQDAGSKMLPLTGAISGIGVSAVKTTADFDSAMSNVSAISGATGKDLDDLRGKAREMGSSTKFSASEAADAMGYMAMAGWKTKDMIGGIEGVMNLASASGEDLAKSSDILTDSLTGFGKSAEESGKLADIMASASSNANTNVSMMGETFKYVASVAGGYGYSMEEMAEMTGLLANAGIKGSEAGTGLRAIMSRLATDAGASTKSLGALGTLTEKLGVQFYNADGSMRPFRDVINDTRKAWSGLTQEEQANYSKKIAGLNAQSAWLALMQASEKDVTKLETAIDNCDGTAKKMADTMNNNLNGQFTILKAQLEELAISFGEMLMPVIRSIVSHIQSFVDKLNSMSEGQRTVVLTITAIVAAIGPLLIAIGKVLSAVGTIMTWAPRIVNGIKLIGPAIKTLCTLIMGWVPRILAALGKVVNIIVTMVTSLAPRILSVLKLIGTGVKALFTLIMAHPVIAIITAIVAAVVLLYNKCEWFRNGVNKIFLAVKDFLAGVVDGIVVFFTETVPDAIDAMVKWFKDIPKNVSKALSSLGKSVSDVFNGIKSTITTIWNGIKAFITTVVNGIKTVIVTVFKAIQLAVKLYITAVKTVITTVWNGIKTVTSKVWNGIKSVVSGALNGIKNAASTISSNIKSKLSAAWNSIKSNTSKTWNNIKSSISSALDGAKKTTSSVSSNIKSKLSTAWSNCKSNTVTAFNNIKSAISTALSGAKTIATTLCGSIKNNMKNAFKNVKSIFLDIGHNVIEGIKSGISKAVGGLYSTIKNSLSGLVKKAKDTLGIHSPSRVFEKEIGENIVNGMIKGINNKKANAKKSAEELSKLYIKSATDKLNELKKANKISEAGEVAFWNSVLKKCKKGTTGYSSALKKVTSARTKLNKDITKLDNQYAKDVKSVTDNLKASIKEITEAYDQAVSDRQKSITSSMGLFSKFEAGEKVEKETLTTNLKDQVNALKTWDETLDALSKRTGMDKGLLDDLQNMEVGSLETLKSLNEMSDAELAEYISLYREKNAIALERAQAENESLKKQSEEDIKKLVDSADKSLNKLEDSYKKNLSKLGVKATDQSKKIGENIVDGLKKGIKSKNSEFQNYLTKFFNSITSTAKKALKIHSPSRVFADVIGANIPAGIAMGIGNNTGLATDAVSNMSDEMLNTAERINGATIKRQLDYTFDGTGDHVLDGRQLIGKLNDIEKRLGSLKVVLDSGTIVGEIVDPMDSALGNKSSRILRGW